MCVCDDRYSPHRVVQQLRACGVLETIRISAAGYPSRWTYKDFYQRYRPLLPRGYFRKGEESAMVVAILKHTIQVSGSPACDGIHGDQNKSLLSTFKLLIVTLMTS